MATTRASSLQEDPTAGIPQADTATIAAQQGITEALGPDYPAMDKLARTQLGDDVVNRYGDVLGARPRKFTDFLRDFSINMAAGGDPTAATGLHMKMREQYERGLTRSLEREQIQRKQDLTTVDAFTQMIQKLPTINKMFRKQYALETSAKIGIPLSKDVAALLASDTIPTDVIASEEFRAMVDEDPRAAVEQLTAAGVDLPAAMDFIQEMQGIRKAKQEQDQRTAEAQQELLERRETKLSIRNAQLQTRKGRLELQDIRKRFKRGEAITGPASRGTSRQGGFVQQFAGPPSKTVTPPSSPGVTPGGNTFRVRQ